MYLKTALLKKVKIYFALIFTLSILASCNAHKEIPYLKAKDEKEVPQETFQGSKGAYEARVMPNDILSITVNSSIPGAAADFNLPMIAATNKNAVQTSVSTATATSGSLQNYIVNSEGKINFPVLGELEIADMTIKEVQTHIASLIYPRYISSNPIVNVRFLNYKIAILGEVSRPGVYNAENGVMTIFDALAEAGDMTIHGKRNNVLLIRTSDNGEIETHRIDLQDKNLLANTDLFYLQQNDKLYIEPNKAKANNSRFGTMESIGLSALSIMISVISLITR